ncbi:NAD(P)/FAD-dependent oxidoreductase, partial [Longimicrobium sp.]|uniref:NAD(P)/FAD-dependent oxidoreductase n=1 Tax=Longimicrobium sp. TaxID=2029185 RepID=UPI002E31EE9C
MHNVETSVAVVGAGPAGCAAALTLRRYLPEMPVVLVSAPAGGGPAAGETLSPGVLPLLDYLGIRAEFLDAGHLPAGGTASAWGSPHVAERSYLFTGRGTGWHLDRARFDAWLLARARAAGATVVHGRALVHAARRSPSGWLLEMEGGGTVRARAVVDATGRAAPFARRQGVRPRRDDALVADIRWYAGDESRRVATGALVETVPDGWWYTASLPGGRAVAMFMTDSDLRRQSAWEARLEDAPATARRVERWHPTGEAAVRAAHSQITPVVTGDGWVAAGDAAAAFDPISALGIGFSLRS